MRYVGRDDITVDVSIAIYITVKKVQQKCLELSSESLLHDIT